MQTESQSKMYTTEFHWVFNTEYKRQVFILLLTSYFIMTPLKVTAYVYYVFFCVKSKKALNKLIKWNNPKQNCSVNEGSFADIDSGSEMLSFQKLAHF